MIEVNMNPTASWDEMVKQTQGLYDEARLARLGTEKFMLDGRHTGPVAATILSSVARARRILRSCAVQTFCVRCWPIGRIIHRFRSSLAACLLAPTKPESPGG